jgi:hypothetical protein
MPYPVPEHQPKRRVHLLLARWCVCGARVVCFLARAVASRRQLAGFARVDNRLILAAAVGYFQSDQGLLAGSVLRSHAFRVESRWNSCGTRPLGYVGLHLVFRGQQVDGGGQCNDLPIDLIVALR